MRPMRLMADFIAEIGKLETELDKKKHTQARDNPTLNFFKIMQNSRNLRSILLRVLENYWHHQSILLRPLENTDIVVTTGYIIWTRHTTFLDAVTSSFSWRLLPYFLEPVYWLVPSITMKTAHRTVPRSWNSKNQTPIRIPKRELTKWRLLSFHDSVKQRKRRRKYYTHYEAAKPEKDSFAMRPGRRRTSAPRPILEIEEMSIVQWNNLFYCNNNFEKFTIKVQKFCR